MTETEKLTGRRPQRWGIESETSGKLWASARLKRCENPIVSRDTPKNRDRGGRVNDPTAQGQLQSVSFMGTPAYFVRELKE